MYMVSWGCPSPGIDPRTPIMSGWSKGLQTSMVAQSWREPSSERLLTRAPVALEGARAAIAGAGRSTARAQSDARIGFRRVIHVKIPAATLQRADGPSFGAGSPAPIRERRVICLRHGTDALSGRGGTARARARV